jgi:uncharacterized protein YgiM (DUF1202 family)
MAIPKLRLITTHNESPVNFATLVMGVNVADGRYIPAGALITTQSAADRLPLASTPRMRSKISKWHRPKLSLVSKPKLRLVSN